MQRARKFSAVYTVKVSSELDEKFLLVGWRAHLGDLVGEELHDDAAGWGAADGDIEKDVGVRHFDGIGCVWVCREEERELVD